MTKYPNEDLQALHLSILDLIDNSQNNPPHEVGHALICHGACLLLDASAPNYSLGMRTILASIETGIKNSTMHEETK